MRNILKQVTDGDLRMIKIFKAVVDHEGFSKASTFLNIHLSTVSSYIRKLEGRIGLTLCHRGNKGFRLTVEGDDFYKAINELLASVEKYQLNVNKIHQQHKGRVKIGILHDHNLVKEFNFSQAIQDFNRYAPDVTLEIESLENRNILAKLQDGSYDFALVSSLTPSLSPSPSLNYIKLCDKPISLYCSKEHPLFEMPDSDINDELIAQYPSIWLNYVSHEDYRFLAPEFNFKYESNSMEASIYGILSGAYIGALSDGLADSLVQKGQIKAIKPTSYRFEHSKITLATSKFYQPCQLGVKFIEFILQAHNIDVAQSKLELNLRDIN